MSSFDDLRNARLAKLKRLTDARIIAYPANGVSDRTSLAKASRDFEKLAEKKSITFAGRIYALRGHGGSLFCDVGDGKDRFQVYLKKDELGSDSYSLFEEGVDIGDFCEFSGPLFLTQKKEKSLLAKTWTFLAKSVRPLPEKRHGLRDAEERSRRRYLDLIANEGVRGRFETRSRITTHLRHFLDAEGFLEVETPLLHPVAGGAVARPFTTHHNALDQDLYLRIAPELYLKRLLVGGFEKVYEIGRNFRNEGIDAEHNPEFTMLELYEAYANAEAHRAFLERVFGALVAEFAPSLAIRYQGVELSFGRRFDSLTFEEGLERFALISDYASLSESDIETRARQLGIEREKGDTKAKLADKVFKKVCVPKIIQPTFVLNYPLEILPLTKESETHPGFADMYQLIIAGVEVAKGFSELNDPAEQRRRFEAQEAERAAGSEEANRMDEDFVEALEYGMPPAAGIGIGIDRLVMLLTDTANIRDVILFPTMRPR
ncbi:MAG: lysine--tRNA ligase [Candidatus Niyogibacteria bacterium]|nr:lysine--tRNA ligase [Candidatus Niyogibacteria bacterium]